MNKLKRKLFQRTCSLDNIKDLGLTKLQALLNNLHSEDVIEFIMSLQLILRDNIEM